MKKKETTRKSNLKTKKIFSLLAAVMTAATFTACSSEVDNPVNDDHSFGGKDATLVTNDQELRSAITNGASVTLKNDIELSNNTLEIRANTTVTIDLAGFTLDRKLTKRGDNGG